jgi:hypothetical protein
MVNIYLSPEAVFTSSSVVLVCYQLDGQSALLLCLLFKIETFNYNTFMDWVQFRYNTVGSILYNDFSCLFILSL